MLYISDSHPQDYVQLYSSAFTAMTSTLPDFVSVMVARSDAELTADHVYNAGQPDPSGWTPPLPMPAPVPAPAPALAMSPAAVAVPAPAPASEEELEEQEEQEEA